MFPTWLLTVIAALPLLWLLISLGWLRFSALKASLLGLGLAIVSALVFYRFSLGHAIAAVVEGTILALWPIFWAIFGAIYAYNIGLLTGSIEVIKKMLTQISSDRRIQVLLLAWAFSGFLEGATGYGTAVVIPAGILIALGCEPMFAALICLIGNTAPTAFGAIGIPLITLAKVTDQGIPILSRYVAWQLTPLILILPLIMVWLTAEKKEGFKGVFWITVLSGIVFAGVHYLTAVYIGPELPSMLGGIASLVLIVVWQRISGKNKNYLKEHEKIGIPKAFTAWSPYIILFFLIVVTSSLFPSINHGLEQIQSQFKIEDKRVTVHWILTPGSLMVGSAIIGGFLQGATIRQLGKVFIDTVFQLYKTVLTICAIVGIAKVMSNSGMIGQIATVLSKFAGNFYPVLSPAIGAIGTFLTGSDTSSNILFGQLQKETALNIGFNPQWLAAANDSGATAGKLLSPQNIAIAASVAGLAGKEGDLLKQTFKIFLFYLLVLGTVVYVGC